VNYVMLVRSSGVSPPAQTAALSDHIGPYLEDVLGGDKLVYGHRLDGPETARTVRVRDGGTLVSDGPFAESKEFVAGVDLLRFDSRAEAVSAAAKHPVSWFHSLELWPVVADHDGAVTQAPADGLGSGPAVGLERFGLFLCHDGGPGSREAQSGLARDARAWADRTRADGVSPYAAALAPARSVTTVRVRDGRTQVGDGPADPAERVLVGLVLADLVDRDAAVALAATHPLARAHWIEVRPFRRD
jgi:hypothetical protein